MRPGLSNSLLIIFVTLSVTLTASEPFYHTVKVKEGDGVYALLRRYKLLDHPCNRNHFYKINHLKPGDKLLKNTEYKIPVLIYEYNGTSIRTTVGIDDWEQAVRIKEYNEAILTEKLRKTRYTDSNILWVPYHEIHCMDERSQGTNTESVGEVKATPVASKGHYHLDNLYGEKHKLIEIKDESLAGRVYYIVSGHGGPDPGARCTSCSNTLCEDEYAYDVSLRLSRYLIAHGAQVHMIIQDKNDGIRDDKFLDCDSDEICMNSKIPLNQKSRLQQRCKAVNNLYVQNKKKGVKEQVVIMIHVDSYTREKRQDVYFFHHPHSKSSKRLANTLQNTFKEKYNYYQKGRGYKGYVKGRNLYMVRNTYPTSVYVELANIRNAADQERLILSSNREALAKWLYEGLARYND